MNGQWLYNLKKKMKFGDFEKELEKQKILTIMYDIIKKENSFNLLSKQAIYKIIKKFDQNKIPNFCIDIPKPFQDENPFSPQLKNFNHILIQGLIIYDKFELIHEKAFQLIKEYIEGNLEVVECLLIKNHIIIKFNDDSSYMKNWSMIAKPHYGNLFKEEYLLISQSVQERDTFINSKKDSMNNYLQGISNKAYVYINDNLSILNCIPTIEQNNNNLQGSIVDNNYYDISKAYKNEKPKIGLGNIGATCYMNATIQCFCNIKKLINFFKYDIRAQVASSKHNTLTYSFKLLIDNLWPSNFDNKSPKSYEPHEFKKKISDLNPLFQGVAANDSKDLVNFIIMTLHTELNPASNDNTNYIQEQNQNQGNKQLLYQKHKLSFSNNYKSKISELFYGTNCSQVKCTFCQNSFFNFQIYFFIVFSLEEVRKFRSQQQMNYNNNMFNMYNNMNNINNNQNDNIVDLKDCFNYDRRINAMQGDNAMFCNYCHKITPSNSQSTLVTLPEVLIILLNRGHGIQYNIKLQFYEKMNFSEYIDEIDKQQGNYNYKLIGVITHIGGNNMTGHFIAYCLHPLENTWYKYNDAFVSKVNNFQDEVVSYAMPYLLFYQKE